MALAPALISAFSPALIAQIHRQRAVVSAFSEAIQAKLALASIESIDREITLAAARVELLHSLVRYQQAERLAARPPNPKLEAAQAELRSRFGVRPEPRTLPMVDTFAEQHYAVRQLAEKWAFHPNTIIREANKETEGIQRTGVSKKTMRISDSAARRIYARLTRN